MKTAIIRAALYMLMLIIMFPASLLAEAVFLKDGSIIEGRLVNENGETMEVRTSDGQIKKIKRSNIVRILYEDDYRRPTRIVLMEGTVMEGYIVDEDRENYYIREKLNSSDERRISKNEVEYIERLKIERRKPLSTGIYAMPLIAVPTGGSFKHYNDTGFGLLVSYSFDDLLINNFSAAAVSGYIHYPGKNGVEYSFNVPLLASIKYSFEIYRHWTVAPVLMPGICLDYIAYSTPQNSTYITGGGFIIGNANAKERWGIEPLVLTGIELAWHYSADITVTAGAYCSAIIEKEEALLSMVYTAGCGIRL